MVNFLLLIPTSTVLLFRPGEAYLTQALHTDVIAGSQWKIKLDNKEFYGIQIK